MTVLNMPGLSPREDAALGELLEQLQHTRHRNLLRQRYLNSKQAIRQLGIAVPPSMHQLETVMGWPNKATMVLSRRIKYDGIISQGIPGIDKIFRDNEIDLQAPQLHTSALSYGVAFLAILPGYMVGADSVRIIPRSALEMTALWDYKNRKITAAVSVQRGNDERISEFLLFLPDRYVTGYRDMFNVWHTRGYANPTGVVTVAMLLYQPDLDRPFGRSKISRTVMSLTDQAVRTMLRTEIAAEFFSVPQRYIMGAAEDAFVDKDGNARTGWEVTIGNILALARDDDALSGDGLPTVGQFPQMSMQPNIEHLRSLAASFAGEANIPVNSLGIIHDNPASDAAMQTAYLDLVQDAEACHETFGAGYAQAAKIAYLVENEATDFGDADPSTIRARFRNASTPTKAAQTQAVIAQVTAGILPVDSEVTLEQLSYDAVTIQRILSDRRRAAASNRLAQLRTASPPPQAAPGQPATATPSPPGA